MPESSSESSDDFVYETCADTFSVAPPLTVSTTSITNPIVSNIGQGLSECSGIIKINLLIQILNQLFWFF